LDFEVVFLVAGFFEAGFLGVVFFTVGFLVAAFFTVFETVFLDVLDLFFVEESFFIPIPPTLVIGEYDALEILAKVWTGLPASMGVLLLWPNIGDPLGTAAGTPPPYFRDGILPPVRIVFP
jgi:hypothetical protein